MAPSPPDLKIPRSSTTVDVRIIDTTLHISEVPLTLLMQPEIQGFTTLSCPSYSFLIEHPSNRKLLYDLGMRKDPENLAPQILTPQIYEFIKNGNITARQGVREQLEEHGVDGKDIEGIIWSHWHFDHIGDPSTFEKSTALIVGPGFKDAFTPGYPANVDSPIRESDYEGRELREITFSQGLKIGHFDAFDYFGDGSFYLLDSPGHTIGHICGLARVTANSFILMGGDACHHGGEFRPSQYLPLPSAISPNPLDLKSSNPCPGALLENLLPGGDKTKPFYKLARSEDGKGIHHDVDEAERTIEKVMEADARDEVLVVIAHDESLLNVVDFFPEYANDFKAKGWAEKGRWLFLKDFVGAVKK